MLVILLNISSGVCLFIGVQHLLLGLKKIDKATHFSFAALSIFLAIYFVLHTQLYNAEQISEFVLFAKLDMLMLPLLSISLIWFIAYYTKDINMLVLSAITSVCLAVMFVNLLSPFSIIYSEVYALEPIKIFFGDQIVVPNASVSTWHFLLDLSLLVISIYLFYALYRLFRHSTIRKALFFGVLFLVIILAAFHDYAVVSDYINAMFLLDFALLVFVIFLSVQLVIDHSKAGELSRDTLKSERKWRAFLEQVDIFVVGLNRMGNVDYINPYFLLKTGYKSEEVLGKDWFDRFLPKRESYQVQSAFLEIIKNDFHPTYKNSIVDYSGNEIPVAWYNVRLTDDSDRIVGSLSIGVDITEYVEKEEELTDIISKLKEMTNEE